MVRIISIILEFVLVILLAQYMGASEYGLYAFAYSVLRICAIPAQAGLPTLIVREVSKYKLKAEWNYIKGILISSNIIVIMMSISIFCIIAVIGFVLGSHSITDNLLLYYYSFALLPFIALGNIRGAMLRGLGMITIGQIPEAIIRPSLLLFLACIMHNIFFKIDASTSMMLHVVSSLIAFCLGAIFLWKYAPRQLKHAKPLFQTKRLLIRAIPLSAIMGTTTFLNQMSIIIIGWFRSPAEIGEFAVAMQISMICLLPATIVNISIATLVAELFTKNDFQNLQSILKASTIILCASTLLIVIIFYVFGGFIFSKILGDEFDSVKYITLILTSSYFVGSLSGASMIFLNMSGQEHSVLRSLMYTLVIAFMLNVALIPVFGIIGAAFAMGSGIIIQNVLLAYSIEKHSSLSPIPFRGT